MTGYISENKKGNIVFSAGLQKPEPRCSPAIAATRRTDMTLRLHQPGRDHRRLHDGARRPHQRQGGSTPIGDGKPDTRQPVRRGRPVLHQQRQRAASRPFISTRRPLQLQPSNYLYTPSSRYNLYSAGHVQADGPTVETFFEASYMNRTSDQQLAPEPFSIAVPISKDSIYNPLGVRRPGLRSAVSRSSARGTSYRTSTRSASSAALQGAVPKDVAGVPELQVGGCRTTTVAPARIRQEPGQPDQEPARASARPELHQRQRRADLRHAGRSRSPAACR